LSYFYGKIKIYVLIYKNKNKNIREDYESKITTIGIKTRKKGKRSIGGDNFCDESYCSIWYNRTHILAFWQRRCKSLLID